MGPGSNYGVTMGPGSGYKAKGATTEPGIHWRVSEPLQSPQCTREPARVHSTIKRARNPRRAQEPTRELVRNYRESLGSCVQGMYGKSVCVCVCVCGGGHAGHPYILAVRTC